MSHRHVQRSDPSLGLSVPAFILHQESDDDKGTYQNPWVLEQGLSFPGATVLGYVMSFAKYGAYSDPALKDDRIVSRTFAKGERTNCLSAFILIGHQKVVQTL